MAISEVARRYAKALLSLNKESNTHLLIMQELDIISEAITSGPEVVAFFENAILSEKEKGIKLRLLLAAKGVAPEILSLIDLLTLKKRLSYLSEIATAFHEQIDLEDHLTRGTVTSAKILTGEMKVELESKITKIVNKKVILTYNEDASLIGGMIAQVGGWKFDDSIDTHLKRMSEELNRRVN